jgi:hypothetical protein
MFVFINKNTMNNIKSYTSRFNSLLEYKTGDIKPLLNEGFDQAAMTQMVAKSNELLGVGIGRKNRIFFVSTDKTINDQYKQSSLHVLLEKESPPPRMA